MTDRYDLGHFDQVSSIPSPQLVYRHFHFTKSFGIFRDFRKILLFSSKDASTVTGIHIHEFEFLVFLLTIKTDDLNGRI